jgi:Leucine-rich repeat (LRR) protein
MIEEVKNLGFATRLTHLYLQSNYIRDFPASGFASLKKLYLDGNCISYLSGLQEAINLEELHVCRQNLPEAQPLLFDPATLSALSSRLRVLNVSKNNIFDLQQFTAFVALKEMLATE